MSDNYAFPTGMFPFIITDAQGTGCLADVLNHASVSFVVDHTYARWHGFHNTIIMKQPVGTYAWAGVTSSYFYDKFYQALP